VVIGEEIASALSAQAGIEVTLQHRDVARKLGPAPEGKRSGPPVARAAERPSQTSLDEERGGSR
jgi:hypothetical protein